MMRAKREGSNNGLKNVKLFYGLGMNCHQPFRLWRFGVDPSTADPFSAVNFPPLGRIAEFLLFAATFTRVAAESAVLRAQMDGRGAFGFSTLVAAEPSDTDTFDCRLRALDIVKDESAIRAGGCERKTGRGFRAV